jgi:hypothetical protein
VSLEKDSMDHAAQDEWLVTHIPHRIRAAIARLPLQEELLAALLVADSHAVRARCDGNAIWEGRLVAVRWLIEFVGVKDKHGKPARPTPVGADASISMMSGGTPFDLQLPDAIFLARVWKGCSQASSHATHASSHPPVGEAELDRAMSIVMAHLDRTVYAAHHCKIAAASLHVENR